VGAGRLSQRDASWHDPLSRVGIVAALPIEARALTATIADRGVPFALDDGTLLAVSGIGTCAAAAAAHALISAGATALASFGVAGGLDPAMKAGAIFLPAEVISDGPSSFRTSKPWCERVAAGLAKHQPIVEGKLLTSARAITAIAAKAIAFNETGALAVDMESAALGQIATARGLPFLVVRVIVDTATDTLPRSVMTASSSGELRLGRLIRALCSAPAEIVGVIRLARRFRAAQRSLRAVAEIDSLREAGVP
jgi:adenosylhomocysteine nucleosidase